jgi:hypothetical protein
LWFFARHVDCVVIQPEGALVLAGCIMSAARSLLCVCVCVCAAPSRSDGATPVEALAESARAILNLPDVGRAKSTPLRTLLGINRPTPAAAPDRSQANERGPAELLLVRVSRRVLEQRVNRDVDRVEPVRDVILGTQIRGSARVQGTSRLVFEQNGKRAVVNAIFVGSIESQTTGHNGPVVLNFEGSAPFRAATRIVLGPEGMQISPTTATAKLSSRTTGIEARSRGVLGRLAERVAWRRSNRLQTEADAIASRHVVAQIRRVFDAEVREVAAVMEHSLTCCLPKLSATLDRAPIAVRYRSAPGHIEIVLYRPDATVEERALRPPPIVGDPAIAVRVHRGVLMQTVGAANLKHMLAPLLTGQIAAAPGAVRPGDATYEVDWSDDGNWLAVDHVDGPPDTAAGDPPTEASIVANP